MSKNFQKGFTLLEILLVIAVAAIAITIAALSFSKLNENLALDKSAELAVSVLNEARALTLSAKESSQYGVDIQPSQLVLFKGSSYSPLDEGNVSTPFNSLVGVRNITLSGGGTSIVFSRLTGTIDGTGTFELYLLGATTTYRTITVTATGVAEAN